MSDTAQFLGCSPLLNTSLGPTGKAGQNYKYYLILGGPKAGVYVDQKLASLLARNSSQKEPKGYNDKNLINHTWTYYCQETHEHSPDQKEPYRSLFVSDQSNHVESQDTIDSMAQEIQSLNLQATTPARDPHGCIRGTVLNKFTDKFFYETF
ncbi:hypothetical protein K435DRAFT_798645 [Dendrothele bispora CBS 962.96]|uniref:Uncharacterized protein n=1 Tax=Dendrothele bispora (strain CBS 962.96) TaxID=1314807 RepID=A0A4S8LYK4_DENBC|nr:hypothetical protein K435DRAFT_798645 [Dendrothele bispora CBS 962.96]